MGDYFRNKVAAVAGAAASALGAIKENNLKKEAERLNAPYPGKVHPLPTDVTKPEQVQSLAGAARSFEDHLDFVFNNVGIGMTLPTEKVTFDLWRRIVDLDLFCDASKGRWTKGKLPYKRNMQPGEDWVRKT
ncbi:MAG: SDR family NAD(P)-dependent oxidoreductase [Thermovirgaceae bacterium]|jgi:NAD(P)-dependent dehydrogenase (short-subunit alcohol dehydrogenase family)|nr:SDR family NAD(P)-dependent oxidoreductase [Thermovirga sp.]